MWSCTPAPSPVTSPVATANLSSTTSGMSSVVATPAALGRACSSAVGLWRRQAVSRGPEGTDRRMNSGTSGDASRSGWTLNAISCCIRRADALALASLFRNPRGHRSKAAATKATITSPCGGIHCNIPLTRGSSHLWLGRTSRLLGPLTFGQPCNSLSTRGNSNGNGFVDPSVGKSAIGIGHHLRWTRTAPKWPQSTVAVAAPSALSSKKDRNDPVSDGNNSGSDGKVNAVSAQDRKRRPASKPRRDAPGSTIVTVNASSHSDAKDGGISSDTTRHSRRRKFVDALTPAVPNERRGTAAVPPRAAVPHAQTAEAAGVSVATGQLGAKAAASAAEAGAAATTEKVAATNTSRAIRKRRPASGTVAAPASDYVASSTAGGDGGGGSAGTPVDGASSSSSSSSNIDRDDGDTINGGRRSYLRVTHGLAPVVLANGAFGAGETAPSQARDASNEQEGTLEQSGGRASNPSPTTISTTPIVESARGFATKSAMQRPVRGCALTGLRTVISRPGRRSRSGSIGSKAYNSTSNAASISTNNTAAIQMDTELDSAALLGEGGGGSGAPRCAVPEAITFQGKIADVTTVNRHISSPTSATTAHSAVAVSLPDPPAATVAGTAGAGDLGPGDLGLRRQMSGEKHKARLNKIFQSVDFNDEASVTRLASAAAASAAVAATAATTTASSTAASSTAATVPAAATGVLGFKALDNSGGVSGDMSRTLKPSNSRDGNSSAGVAVTAHGGGSRWDEQLLEDEFAGMADLMDFGYDYDRAVPQRAGGPGVAGAAIVAGAAGSAAGGAAAVARPETASASESPLLLGSGVNLYHDLVMGSVWMDGDSSEDEGGHHVRSFATATATATSVTTATVATTNATGTAAAANPGAATATNTTTITTDGGSSSGRAPLTQVSSNHVLMPPLSSATGSAKTADSTTMTATAEGVAVVAAAELEAVREASGQPSGSAAAVDLESQSTGFGDDLDGLLQFAGNSSGRWNNGDEAGSNNLNDSGGGGGGGVNDSESLDHASGMSAGIAIGVKTPLLYSPDDDDLFGFDFSYVAPIAAQAPIQLLAASAAAAAAGQLPSLRQPKRWRQSPNEEQVRRQHQPKPSRMQQERAWAQELDVKNGDGTEGPGRPMAPVRFHKGTRESSHMPLTRASNDEVIRIGDDDCAPVQGGSPKHGMKNVLSRKVRTATAGGLADCSSTARGTLSATTTPAISFRRLMRRAGSNDGSGNRSEALENTAGGLDIGTSSSNTGSSSSSSSSAALLLQELLAPVRGTQYPAGVQLGSSNNSNNRSNVNNVYNGNGGVEDGDGSSNRAGGRRGGGYLTRTQEGPTESQLPLKSHGEPKPAAPPGGWKPRGTSETTLFVKGLDPSQGEERLREALAQLFSSAGRIVQIRLPCDSRRQPKGIAYIVFESPEEKVRAVALDGSRLLGRVIRVDANVD